MFPQLGVGGCTPRPRYDRLASKITTVATVNVANTTSGAMMLGRMCVRIIWPSDTPMTRAASMNVDSRRAEDLAPDDPCAT